MGKYSALRKLNCLLQTKTAIVDGHRPMMALIDLSTFDVAQRIAIASGMEALPTVRCGVATIPEPDTS
jgi:hypothetical protein